MAGDTNQLLMGNFGIRLPSWFGAGKTENGGLANHEDGLVLFGRRAVGQPGNTHLL